MLAHLHVNLNISEESIDIEALHNLLLDDLKILIPSIGLRTKFRVQWTEWKNREIEKLFLVIFLYLIRLYFVMYIQNRFF
jgi:hypothetical protein